MKKSLLSAVAMLLACCGAANASVDVTAVNVPQPVADTLLFQLPVTPGLSQEIWTTYDDPMSGNHLRPTKYQPEYLVTALDFTKGDTDKGTATLPANAKVIGLGLDGYLQACDDENNCAQSVTAWCRNIPRDKMILDKLDLWDGYNTVLPTLTLISVIRISVATCAQSMSTPMRTTFVLSSRFPLVIPMIPACLSGTRARTST